MHHKRRFKKEDYIFTTSKNVKIHLIKKSVKIEKTKIISDINESNDHDLIQDFYTRTFNNLIALHNKETLERFNHNPTSRYCTLLPNDIVTIKNFFN
jgi:hypothetical protein